jgi:single-strand DNA-binding protein
MSALQVSGVCRLGADPDLHFTPSGAAVCSARAVFQDRYQDRQSGEWKDGDTTWVSLIGWRQLAENMAESFKKGDDVMVTGTLVVREYKKNDGSPGYATEVKVWDIGPSIRFNAAKSARVDRQYDGPAAGPAEDPWDRAPGVRQQAASARPNQDQQAGPPARGQWQKSGQPVQQAARFDPVTGQPLVPTGGFDDSQPPF